MAEFPRTPTPATMEELAPLLAAGLQERLQAVPARELALLMLALIAEENANGKAIIQGNIGNLAAGGYANGVEHISYGNFWRPEWFAQADVDKITDPVRKKLYQDLHADMLAGRNAVPSAFRAYPGGLKDGLSGFLDLLFKPLYHPLLVAAATGNPLAFAMEIKRHYNADGAPPGPLANTLGSLAASFEQKGLFSSLPKGVGISVPAQPSSPPSPSGLSPSDVRVAGAGNAYLFEIRTGVHGALVRVLQRLLGLPQTGFYDAATEKAVEDFQEAHGLKKDGWVGPKTWTVLLESPIPQKGP